MNEGDDTAVSVLVAVDTDVAERLQRRGMGERDKTVVAIPGVCEVADVAALGFVNVCNFAKAADGEPTLLSFDDARRLFHEFGHALHGLLSSVTYPSISGTSVATDFVELPSQLYEHWLEQPDVLRRFAKHYRTGAPMPEDLLRRLIAARNFGQGFATVEYVASAIVDLDFLCFVAEGSEERGLDLIFQPMVGWLFDLMLLCRLLPGCGLFYRLNAECKNGNWWIDEDALSNSPHDIVWIDHDKK